MALRPTVQTFQKLACVFEKLSVRLHMPLPGPTSEGPPCMWDTFLKVPLISLSFCGRDPLKLSHGDVLRNFTANRAAKLQGF